MNFELNWLFVITGENCSIDLRLFYQQVQNRVPSSYNQDYVIFIYF